MYLDCPMKFKLVQINQLPFASIYMDRGTYMHDVCEKFFNRMHYNEIHPSKFEKVLRSIMGDKFDEEPFYLWTQNFIDLEIERFEKVPLFHYRPKLKEVKLYDLVNNISGVVDRIDYDPDIGRHTLWDYKTGTVGSIKKNMFELALYAHLFNVAYPDKAIPRIGIYGLKDGKKYMTEISREQMMKAVNIVNWVHTQIDAERYYVNENANCFWCPENVKKACKEIRERKVEE